MKIKSIPTPFIGLCVWVARLLISVAISLAYIYSIISMIYSKWEIIYPTVQPSNGAPDVGGFAIFVMITAVVTLFGLLILFFIFMGIKKLTINYFEGK